MSADWSDYIKDITRRFPKSVPKFYNRPIAGRRSADKSADEKWRATIGRSSDRPTHRPMICGSFEYDIGRLIGRSSADRRPTIGRSSANCRNPKTVGRWKKNYNKVVIIYFFCRPMKKELKSGILSADKSRPMKKELKSGILSATFELSYSVSHIRANTAIGFEKLYSNNNIHCYEYSYCLIYFLFNMQIRLIPF